MIYNKKSYYIELIKSHIKEMIGVEPFLVGSVGMGIEIDESDIDFAVCSKNIQEMHLMKEKLEKNNIEFRGERPATEKTSRYLFSFWWKSYFVDIIILLENDYDELIHGVITAYDTLSMDEKQTIINTKKELLLKSEYEYEAYKISIYQRFCPNLLWLTDIEICKMLINQYESKNIALPNWLSDKKNEYGINSLT